METDSGSPFESRIMPSTVSGLISSVLKLSDIVGLVICFDISEYVLEIVELRSLRIVGRKEFDNPFDFVVGLGVLEEVSSLGRARESLEELELV